MVAKVQRLETRLMPCGNQDAMLFMGSGCRIPWESMPCTGDREAFKAARIRLSLIGISQILHRIQFPDNLPLAMCDSRKNPRERDLGSREIAKMGTGGGY